MIPCPHCKKSHREMDAVEKCKVRAERRAVREEAKKADVERRLKNRKALPEEAFVHKSVTECLHWDKILSGLKKNYPAREQGPWTLYEVVEIDSKRLNWPTDLTTITLLRLERLVTGDFISKHPLALPVDGSYSLEGAA